MPAGKPGKKTGCRLTSATPRTMSQDPVPSCPLGVPPAVLEVGTRRTLPDHERVAHPVTDVSEPHGGIAEQQAVVPQLIDPLDAQVAREGGDAAGEDQLAEPRRPSSGR